MQSGDASRTLALSSNLRANEARTSAFAETICATDEVALLEVVGTEILHFIEAD